MKREKGNMEKESEIAPREQHMSSAEWDQYLARARQFQIGTMAEVRGIIVDTVGRTLFGHTPDITFITVVALDPESGEPSRDMYDAGPDILELLERLPRPVATRMDPDIEVLQVRQIQGRSFDITQGVTALLMYFLHNKQSGECFLPPDDEPSHVSWREFQRLAALIQARQAGDLEEGAEQKIQ